MINGQILAQTETLDLPPSYRQFLNFELDSCIQTLDKSSSLPFNFYLKSLALSTDIFVSDDISYYKKHQSLENDLLEDLDQLKLTDEYTNFLKSEIKLQWAILKLKNGDEFSSFWSLRQAYNIAKENVKHYPDFLPSYKTLGLLHVLYGVFPNKYDWILSLFGIDGDVAKGLQELEKIKQSDHVLSLETNMTTALLYAYLLNNSENGASIMAKIHEKNSLLLVDYAFALILMKNAQSDQALTIINDSYENNPQPSKIPQLYYLNGEIMLQKGQLNEAIKYYKKFLSHCTGKNLIKDSYYKIGVCYLIQSNDEESEASFNQAKESGWAKNEADNNAKLMLAAENSPNKELLQLRYATDGGFYENATKINEHIKVDLLNDHDKCEYFYRSARLYHKTNEIEKAIKNYQKAINSQGNEKWYFAPNSALQIGLLYISQGDKENATLYLKKISDYRGYPYQNSIQQKAKSALNQLH